ncbi:hypothetical protein SPHV1_980005 [Novosphingobium sp. KN65.2]|nr:hypothetical protein SPHV1_980005 [Novosphingobium sp. KN65.2]
MTMAESATIDPREWIKVHAVKSTEIVAKN